MADDYGSTDFTPITVDIEAIKSASFNDGRLAGLEEGRQKGFVEGYSEGIGDLIERVRSLDQFASPEHSHCLEVLVGVAGQMARPS